MTRRQLHGELTGGSGPGRWRRACRGIQGQSDGMLGMRGWEGSRVQECLR
jgi:hypothetical protein